MANYKADTTLNEKDSLLDLLNTEKSLAKLYNTALTEGVSKGFRSIINECQSSELTDQFNVFLLMTELDYARVISAEEKDLADIKEKFLRVKKQLE